MFSQTTLILGLASSAFAHMRMAEPKPFGLSTLDSSPLAPKDFPCKQRAGVYAMDSGMNQWNAGETKEIVMMGTAAHGGGSCQYSITTDPEPTEKSQWKVIHSVIGNCLTTQAGNYLDRESQGIPAMKEQVATNHTVTMPSSIPDGRYTFAWTWLNKVGNREFYMNCAPIQVGSGSKTASTASAAKAMSALPDMYVANLPGKEAGGCATTEGQDFDYPNPGQSVTRGTTNVKLGNDIMPEYSSGCKTINAMGAGAGSIGSPSPGTPSTPSQGTAPATPSKSTVPSQPSYAPSQPQQPAATPGSGYGTPQPSKIPTNPNGGVYAPGASSAPVAVPSPQSPPAAAQPSPPAAKPVPSTTPQTPQTPQTPSGNTSSPPNGECTPCTNDGAVVCIGSKQFGLCNRGCAVAQDLAAGMTCSAGAVVASTKRHLHFPRAHLHRRFTAARFL